MTSDPKMSNMFIFDFMGHEEKTKICDFSFVFTGMQPLLQLSNGRSISLPFHPNQVLFSNPAQDANYEE